MSELTHEDVAKILKIIDGMGERDISLEIGDLKLQVTHGTPLPAPAPGKPATATPPGQAPAPARAAKSVASPLPARPAIPAGHVAVSAPSIGTFYRAPAPGAKPFVEIGDRVGPDDIVCVFDVMKLFSSLKAGVAGTVAAILVENQATVEQGQSMILIKPD